VSPSGGVIASSRVRGGVFDPLSVDGCILWLDAADTSTIAVVGATTETDTITSKSVDGAVWARSSVGRGPITNTDTVNDLNVLTFNSDLIQAPTSWATSPNPQAITLFIVAYHDETTIQGLWDGAPFTTNAFRAFAGNWELITTNTCAVAATATASEVQLWTVKASNARSMSVSKNGATPTTNTAGSANISWIVPGIGAINGNFTWRWNGRLCEVLAYDSQLSSGDTSSVNNYLNDKWSVY
jgi:hypothetical protein